LRYDLPSKKISLQKSSAFEFLNLTLKKRGAFGIAQNHWLSLANAKEKISENDLTLIMVCLLKEARTYFSKNSGTLPSHTGSHTLLDRMTRHES
jgi:hypothetical protein